MNDKLITSIPTVPFTVAEKEIKGIRQHHFEDLNEFNDWMMKIQNEGHEGYEGQKMPKAIWVDPKTFSNLRIMSRTSTYYKTAMDSIYTFVLYGIIVSIDKKVVQNAR